MFIDIYCCAWYYLDLTRRAAARFAVRFVRGFLENLPVLGDSAILAVLAVTFLTALVLVSGVR